MSFVIYIYIYIYTYVDKVFNLQSPLGSESTIEMCYIYIPSTHTYIYIYIYIYIHIYKWITFSKVRVHLVASRMMRCATYTSPQREHKRTNLSRFSIILDSLSLLSESSASRLFRTIMGWLL